MNEHFTVSFPAAGKYLQPLRKWCRTFFEDMLPEAEIEGLMIAMSEACANYIEHCCGNDARRDVTVRFDVLKGRVVVSIRDFCGRTQLSSIKSRRLKDVRPGGLGMRFISKSVNKVEFIPQDDGLLTLALTMNKPAKRKRGTARGS